MRKLVARRSGSALAALVLAKAVRPVVAEAIDPQQAAVTGVVFEDRNGNDRQDPGERGVRGVSVSDGKCDRRRPTARAATGSTSTSPADHRPGVHHQAGRLRGPHRPVHDAALLPRPRQARRRRGRDRRLRAAARPARPQRRLHVRQRRRPARQRATSQSQIARRSTSTSQEPGLRRRSAATSPTTPPTPSSRPTGRGTAASRLPVWPAVGNHEYFNGGAATYAARIDNYRRHVGPEWYSFDYGNRHFLVLENNGAAPFEEQRDVDRAATSRPTPTASASVVLTHHADERAVRLAVAVRRATADLLEQYDTELMLVGHEHSNDVDRTTWVEGRQAHPDQLELVHDRPQPARLPLRPRCRARSFDEPVPDVRRSSARCAITIPGAGRASCRATRSTRSRSTRTTTNEALWDVRYRVDGRGSWRAARPSGELHVAGRALERAAATRHAHGSRSRPWTRAARRWTQDVDVSRSRAERAREIDPGADWAQYHGDATPHRHRAATCSRRTCSWPGRTARAGTLLTGSPVDRRRRRLRRHPRRERHDSAAASTRVDLRSGQDAVGVRHADVRCTASPAVDRGTVLRRRRSHGTLYAVRRPHRASCAGSASPSRRDPPFNQRSYSYYSPAVADGTVYWPYQTRYGKASRGLLAALDARTGATRSGSRR